MEGMPEKTNSAFKSTCKILFREEIGDLAEFEPYLKEAMLPNTTANCSVSGKQIILSGSHYPKAARFVSQDQVEKLKKPQLSINSIKDIDSLFEAAAEQATFCGNKIFGKNIEVCMADNCVDCSNIFYSHDIFQSKNAAFCSVGRYSESIFGVTFFRGISHCIRCIRCASVSTFGAARCFETYLSDNVSDCYYAINCSGSSDCMFCFNLRNSRNCIGNLELPREKYLALKKKLVSEMAQTLCSRKRIFSLGKIMACKDQGEQAIPFSPPPASIDRAFSSATKIVLGKEQASAAKFGNWLSSRSLGVKKVKGKSEEPAYRAEIPMVGNSAKGNLASFKRANESKAKIKIGQAEDVSLSGIASKAGKIAVLTHEFVEGRNNNATETPSLADSSNVHRLWYGIASSDSAFSSIVTESKYIFGGGERILNCEFCISCFNLTRCKNCFETDSSYLCSSCFFCHNCENVEEGIFCFNAKGLRYAVFNQQLPKEEYFRIKKILLDYINNELEKKGGLDISIFSLGTRKNSK